MFELPAGQTLGMPERAVDLRLCRLACMGFGVVDETASQWYTEPEGRSLHLVVQLEVHARWQGRQLDSAELGPHVLVCAGLKLRDVGEAALFANWFALMHGDACRLSREPVCCRHLRADGNTTGELSCCWGPEKPQSAAQNSWAEQLDEGLKAAFLEWQHETTAVQQQYRAKLEEWQRLGALF